MDNQTVTLSTTQIRIAYETVSRLVDTKFKPKASYWITRLHAALESEYKSSGKIIDTLILELGVQDENGGAHIDTTNVEMVKSFNDAYEPIGSTLISISNPPMISVDAFGDDVEIEPYIFTNLSMFIKD